MFYNFSQNNKSKLQDRLCIFYDPSSGGEIKILPYQEIISLTLGAEHFPEASFLRANNEENLKYYLDILSGHVWLMEDTLTKEINNSSSKRYETSYKKRELILGMERISTTGTTLPFSSYAGSYLDALIVYMANPFSDIIDTHDMHVAVISYQNNRRFIWPFQNDEINRYLKNSKLFLSDFRAKLGRIKNKK